MLYIIIALLAVAAVVYLIAKKVHAAAAIFFVGVLLLMAAALTGRTEFRSTDIDPSGNALYDQLLVVEALFKSRFSGIGMAIMVLFGFVSYMRHIGADAKTVVILSAPLRRFRGSYWLVPVGFLIGNLLSLVIPSASALSLLLVATLLPALIAAGLTPLTVGAIVVTSSTIIPTPLEAGLIQGADLTDMTVTEFVYGHVAWATVPALVITAFVHMWWQRHCDIVDARHFHNIPQHGMTNLEVNASDAATKDALERASGLPGYYAILPLLPLLLIIASALLKRLDILSFEAGILPVTVVSLYYRALHRILTQTHSHRCRRLCLKLFQRHGRRRCRRSRTISGRCGISRGHHSDGRDRHAHQGSRRFLRRSCTHHPHFCRSNRGHDYPHGIWHRTLLCIL